MRVRSLLGAGLLCLLLSCGTSIPAPTRPVKPEIHGWYAVTIGEGLLKLSDPSGEKWDPGVSAEGAGVIGGLVLVAGTVFSLGSLTPVLAFAVPAGAKAIAGTTLAPDPYAFVRVGDAELETPAARNNPYANWNITVLVRLARGEDHSLRVEVWDRDALSDDDFAGETTVDVADLVAAGRPVRVGPFGAVDAVSVGAEFVAAYDAPPPTAGDLPLPADASVSLVLKRARVAGGKGPGVAIDRALRSRLDPIGACYGDSLRSTPGLRGRITVKIVVNDDGSIAKVKIKRDSVGAPTLAACVTDRIERWTFPPPEGRSVFVYGFVFDPGGGTLRAADIDEAVDEPLEDTPEDTRPPTARGSRCLEYEECVLALARAYEEADFPGAADAAKAMRDSARTIAEVEGPAAEEGCKTGLHSLRRASEAYKSMKGFKFPAECE